LDLSYILIYIVGYLNKWLYI